MKYFQLKYVVIISVLLLISSETIPAATFTVTNTNDAGVSSLRQAIMDANSNSGFDIVVFNISVGVQTINLLTPLPDISDPVSIDGTTQNGFSGNPLIVLNGSNVSGTGDVYGLHITGGSSTIKGLVIVNFSNPAPQGIRIDTNGGNTVQGCYVGVGANGTTRARNHRGIVITSSDNLIGGATIQARNVISGNSFDNVSVVGAGSNNRIEGNFIGTNGAGTASLNGGGNGIEVASTGSNNKVGGIVPGTGNLISGNGQGGIRAGSLGTIIQGNLIGTDVTGTIRVPNATSGIFLDALNSVVGGNTPAARNVISGNNVGISASPFNESSFPKIQGNYIGTDITGLNALGNMGNGIEVNGAVIIGGLDVGERNVIAGNSGGIFLRSNGGAGTIGSIIQGNFIGTNVTGTAGLGLGNGISIASMNNLIGGSQTGAGNVISGNTVGVQIGGTTTAAVRGNTIQGNFIGTGNNGIQPIPNSSSGIIIVGSSDNTIGGINQGEGNTIAFNNGAGISMTSFITSGTQNNVRRNSIYQNNGLGIDLGGSGVTPNDNCDGDSGPNDLQNFPVLTSAKSNKGITRIIGNLNSAPASVFTVEFFVNLSPDVSGNGEGRIYLGSAVLTTDSACNAPINVVFGFQTGDNMFISANVTDVTGSTSEFSNWKRVNGKAVFDFDGDSRTDVSIFRPSVGEWWYLRSLDGSNRAFQFGQSTDKMVAADYTGDGITDVAFFRPSTGEWYILRSEDASFYAFPFGNSSDIPTPADFDGDGKVDPAIFRPSIATWFIIRSSDGGVTILQFGANGDLPVAADYDGDGKADLAIFRPSDGTWWLNRTQAGLIVTTFGTSTDKTVQADYTGDGKADVAFFRPSTREWFVLRSENFSFYSAPFGAVGDIPTPGDYDGDGKYDFAIFRPSSNTWYLLRSTTGFTAVTFGAANDIPIPNAYVR